MDQKSWLILGVAVITWGGVFVYLLRLGALAKKLDEQTRDLKLEEKRDELYS